MPLFAPEAYGEINHLLVLFGREVCKARRPRCGDCVLNDVCPKHGV
jgi:endonuclease-3